MDATKRVNLKLTDEMHKRLKLLCITEDTNLQAKIVSLIIKELKKVKSDEA